MKTPWWINYGGCLVDRLFVLVRSSQIISERRTRDTFFRVDGIRSDDDGGGG